MSSNAYNISRLCLRQFTQGRPSFICTLLIVIPHPIAFIHDSQASSSFFSITSHFPRISHRAVTISHLRVIAFHSDIYR